MRVAIVMVGRELDGGGGAERRFIRVWRFLRAAGVDVHLVLNRALCESAKRIGLFGAGGGTDGLVVVPDRGAAPLGWRCYQELRYRDVDLVHLALAQRMLVPLYAALACDRRIRITHTVALSWFSQRGRAPAPVVALSRWIWALSHCIDSLYAGFLNAYAHPLRFAHKVVVAPCSFTEVVPRPGASQKRNQIAFVGRLIAEKNPLLYIEALDRIRDLKDWNAIVAGGGPLDGAVRASVERRGLAGRVTLGRSAKTSQLLAQSSVFMSLQRTENYPSQALLEAMVAENAVIATDVGETRRLVRPGETGLVAPADPAAIGAALRALVSNAGERQRLGSAARAFVAREHRIERFADHLLGVWRRALP